MDKDQKKNEDKFLVWVNLQIIHDKPITYAAILNFVYQNFPQTTRDKKKYYEKYIKKLAGEHYTYSVANGVKANVKI